MNQAATVKALAAEYLADDGHQPYGMLKSMADGAGVSYRALAVAVARERTARRLRYVERNKHRPGTARRWPELIVSPA